jgi:hypothetical protein
MRRYFVALVIVFVCMIATTSLSFTGCGSADSDGYHAEISDLNEAAADTLNEIAHTMGEEEPAEEAERVEVTSLALEEDIEILGRIIAEMKAVKVPAGLEDFHRELLAFYEGVLLSYEELATTLVPGEEEGEGHGGEGGGSEEEGSAPVEEEPAEGTGH